jgi:hypothetical protein
MLSTDICTGYKHEQDFINGNRSIIAEKSIGNSAANDCGYRKKDQYSQFSANVHNVLLLTPFKPFENPFAPEPKRRCCQVIF